MQQLQCLWGVFGNMSWDIDKAFPESDAALAVESFAGHRSSKSLGNVDVKLFCWGELAGDFPMSMLTQLLTMLIGPLMTLTGLMLLGVETGG